jgi:tRNA-specific 2-thiouridylase
MFHTLGQRQGLGIGGVRGCPDEPWYVLHKDLENNILYVGQGHDHPWLLSGNLLASQLSWVSGHAPEPGTELSAKVRYRQADQSCVVCALDKNRLELHFKEEQRAVTPGQSVVLYEGENCLGGGIIDWADSPPARDDQPLQKQDRN